MRRLEIRIVGAVLLIVVGVLSLLQNLGIFEGGLALLWALLLAAGGVLFLYAFLADRNQWWFIIPGFVLLSVAALIGLEQFVPAFDGDWGGALVTGGIGLAFWAVYFVKREHWWAIIPGGVMLTIAAVIGLSSGLERIGLEVGGVFFLGLGLTFGLLSLLPSPEGRITWALIPAAVFLVMGALITAAAADLLLYLWPAALILGGLYLIFRVLRSR